MIDYDIRLHIEPKARNRLRVSGYIRNKHLISNDKHLALLVKELLEETGKQFNINILVEIQGLKQQ